MENLRIRYKQYEQLGGQNDEKINESAVFKNNLKSCIHEYFQGLESKLQNQTNQLNELEGKMTKKLENFKKDILEAFSQSVKSAEDVHQNVVTRVNRRIKKSFTQL